MVRTCWLNTNVKLLACRTGRVDMVGTGRVDMVGTGRVDMVGTGRVDMVGTSGHG